MRRYSLWVLGPLAIFAATIAVVVLTKRALARPLAAKQETLSPKADSEIEGYIPLQIKPRWDIHKIGGTRPILVSLIRDGQVLYQVETLSGGYPMDGGAAEIPSPPKSWEVLPGQYEVRVEGEGLQTVVKRFQVVAGEQKHDVYMDIQPGEGVRIIEYATGGLSREETAGRIRKLEASVADLQKRIAELEKTVANLARK
jgi:hypothetical protein